MSSTAVTVAADVTASPTIPPSSTTITATALFQLSARGRRASLLVGGDGRRTQRRPVRISASDVDLVQVNGLGEATLILTPRIIATPSGTLRRHPSLPEYDHPPSDEQLLADARALAALRHAYDTQRRAALDAAKADFADQFLRDLSLRALVNPPPTASRCACRAGRRILVFRDTDRGAAATIPVEAHRRFRADLASRTRANRARHEQELATYHAKRAFMTTWVEEQGSDDQRARLAANRLSDAEMHQAIADHVFAPLRGYPRYLHNAYGDLVTCYQGEDPEEAIKITPREVRVEGSLVQHLTAAQWTTLTTMQSLLPAASFSVRRYQISWSRRPAREDPRVVQLAILVKYRVAPLTLVRSFLLPPL